MYLSHSFFVQPICTFFQTFNSYPIWAISINHFSFTSLKHHHLTYVNIHLQLPSFAQSNIYQLVILSHLLQSGLYHWQTQLYSTSIYYYLHTFQPTINLNHTLGTFPFHDNPHILCIHSITVSPTSLVIPSSPAAFSFFKFPIAFITSTLQFPLVHAPFYHHLSFT